jgi:MYXO-CTERM domain-containing protein
MDTTTKTAGVLVLGLMTALMPRGLLACGGCFAPPETVQVVTDHRMVMALHADEAILWDQIQYTGRPQDFAWILPVRGDVRVEVASGFFFDTLDQLTAPQVQAPSVVCPNAGTRGGLFSAAGTAAAEDGRGGVQVLRTEVVGPYQTVTLRSSDAGALTTWLRENRYSIPPALEPVVRAYTDLAMDFVALRLRPGEGVQSMQPVRVRYPGANTILPLRMVAAGVADKVGIKLWVFGEGRFEAMNFPNATIAVGDLVWDFRANRSNYLDVFNGTVRALGGRAWITEAAEPTGNLQGAFETGFGDPAMMADRMAAREDFDLAVRSLRQPVVSRLRADLQAGALDRDLQLQASSGALVSRFLQTTRSVNRNPCPTDDGLYSGTDSARAGRGLECAARPGNGPQGAWAFGLLGLGLLARRRARRERNR